MVERSSVSRKLATLIKGWQKKLPVQPEELWGWLATQKPATVQTLLALGTALTVDMVQMNGADAKPASSDLARAMKLDMADHFEAAADNYFTRVPRKHLLAELGDNLRPQTRKQVEGMKRDMAAKTIVTELKGKRWIPDVLKVV